MKRLTEKAKKKEIKKSLSYSIKDAAAINASGGFGNDYISAYAIAMQATNQQISLLTSIPNLVAPLSQLATSAAMEKTSRKRIFGIAILWQALIWIPIIIVSLFFLKDIKYAPLLVVIFWTVYAAFGNFASPAWASWMGDLVKKEEAGRFFGMRNRIGSITALVSLLIAGLILDRFKKYAQITGIQALIFAGFAFIFLLAMTFKLLSRRYVLKQYEPKFRLQKEYYFSFLSFIKKASKTDYGKFTIYVALMVLVTNIASPFYAVYMLRNLNFSYIQFMLINISGTIAIFLFMPLWGKFADKYGNIKTIKITGFMIPLICFFWILVKNFGWFILAANFFSGLSWAGFNLAAGNFVYDAARPQRRGLCVAYSNVLNGVGVFIGASIGGFLAMYVKIGFMNILMFISLISGILRYLVSFLMTPQIHEVRIVEKYERKLRIIPIPQMHRAFQHLPEYLYRKGK